MNVRLKSYEIKPGFDAVRYLWTYGLLTMLAKKVSARKRRMFVEIASNIDRHILSEGQFEKGVVDLLEQVCRKTGHTRLMIDVGANIGNHTVGLAPVFEKVHAVEPHPVLYRVLEANVIRNGMANVTCHNFGLAGEDVKATLTESVTNHGLSRVKERSQLSPAVFGISEEKFGAAFAVELKSAQEFVGQFGADLDHAFIKIDVEGMEQEIVEAIMPLLKKYKPLVAFEWFSRAQPKMTEIVTGAEGYELYAIRVHDTGKNIPLRALKILFKGRTYTVEKVDPRNLDEVYPLALMLPKDKAGAI